MTAQCEGHIETPDEDYARLLARYGTDTVGFVAELAKKNSERKILHQVLTDAGIPSETPEGRGLCLMARVAIMAEQLKVQTDIARVLVRQPDEPTLRDSIVNDLVVKADDLRERGITFTSAHAIGVARYKRPSECGCGHPYHGNDLCTGTLYTVSDGEYVVQAMREGRKPGEPCVCTEYQPV